MINLEKNNKYTRKQIHDLFSPDTAFKAGAGYWGISGILKVPNASKDYIFLVTFGRQQGEHKFEEEIDENGVLNWQSQPSQTLETPQIIDFINHDETKNNIYLFLRTDKKSPYTYMGRLKYVSHDITRERPVWFKWKIIDWENTKIHNKVQEDILPSTKSNRENYIVKILKALVEKIKLKLRIKKEIEEQPRKTSEVISNESAVNVAIITEETETTNENDGEIPIKTEIEEQSQIADENIPAESVLDVRIKKDEELNEAADDMLTIEHEESMIVDNGKATDTLRSAMRELNSKLENVLQQNEISLPVINDFEKWLEQSDRLKGNYIYEKVYNFTKQFAELNSEIYRDQISEFFLTKEEEKRLEYIREKIKNNKNIGNDIIKIIQLPEMQEKIHNFAKMELLCNLQENMSTNILDEEIVFISLTTIALMNYDGNFYEHIREYYYDIYERYSEQKVEGTIRQFLRKYCVGEDDGNKHRLISKVLENTLVPQKYLPDYFDFMFYIYTNKFNRNITNGNLKEMIRMAFVDLKKELISESDTIKVGNDKTQKIYTLIKSTKKIINCESEVKELVDLSVNVIRLIDNYWWSKEIPDIDNDYYKYGFQKWSDSINKEFGIRVINGAKNRKEQEKLFSARQPKFELNKNDIKLVIPEYKLHSDFINDEVKLIITEDNNEILTIVPNKIIEDRIIFDKINILNPFGNIGYRLEINNEIIYDTKTLLYRKYMLFNEAKKEITNNLNRCGNIYLVYKANSIIEGKTEVVYSGSQYTIVNLYTDEQTKISLNKENIYFASEITNDVEGELLDGVTVNINDRVWPVYKRVDDVILETALPIENIGYRINNKNYKLADREYINQIVGGKNYYFINHDFISGKSYRIEFLDVSKNEKINNKSIEFFIDEKFNVISEKIDKYEYLIKVQSDLNVLENTKKLDIRNFDEFAINIEENGTVYKYNLLLDMPIYKIDNDNWTSFENEVWIDDVKFDSVIKVFGMKMDKCSLYAGERKITNLNPKEKNGFYDFEIGSLRNYTQQFNKVEIVPELKGIALEKIDVYMRNVIKNDSSCYVYNSENGVLTFNVEYYGKNPLLIEVYDKEEIGIFNAEVVSSGQIIIAENIPSNEELKIVISEAVDAFSMQDATVLKEERVRFYKYTDLENCTLKICEIEYQKNTRDFSISKRMYFKSTYFKLDKYIGEAAYLATAFRYEEAKKVYIDNVGQIVVGLLGNISGSVIEAEAGSVERGIQNVRLIDADGLLIDQKLNSILNRDSEKATDIYEYYLRIEKR